MNLTQIRHFVDGRKAGGLGEKDARDLVHLIAGDADAHTLSKTKERQLVRAGDEFGSLFTESGGATFEQLTGHKPHMRARSTGNTGASVAVRASHAAGIPKSWQPVVHVADRMKKLIDEGESLTLRLKSGREMSVDASDQVTDFIKKGYLKLYKNPKDNSDVDDEGHILWYSAHYLVPTPAFEMLYKQVEKFAKRAARITKAISTELEKLHDTMHAARVNGLSPFDLPKIKAEVRAEIPKAKAAIYEYEQAVQQFQQDTQHLDYPNGEVYLMDFAKKALDSVGPHIDALSLRDLNFTKDLIRANELLMVRPEVESVDPGFGGIRICVNTDTLVKNGGDYTKWKQEVTQLLHDQLITDGIDFDKNNNWDKVLDDAQKLLQRAVGAANVRDGYQMGDKDFADHVRGTEVTLYVKKDSLPEAQRHIDELRALFAPHGVDMKHFDLKIEEDN